MNRKKIRIPLKKLFRVYREYIFCIVFSDDKRNFIGWIQKSLVANEFSRIISIYRINKKKSLEANEFQKSFLSIEYLYIYIYIYTLSVRVFVSNKPQKGWKFQNDFKWGPSEQQLKALKVCYLMLIYICRNHSPGPWRVIFGLESYICRIYDRILSEKDCHYDVANSGNSRWTFTFYENLTEHHFIWKVNTAYMSCLNIYNVF